MPVFRLVLIFALSAAVLRADNAPATPEQTLRGLVARQQTLFADAAKHRDSADFDTDNFKSQLQQLADAYELLLRDHPGLAAAHVDYAMMLWKIDMRNEAVGQLIEANQLDPDIPQVKNLLGDYKAEEGRPTEALPFFLAAVKLAPNEPLYHYNLGQLLAEARDDFMETGQWTRAVLDRNMLEAFRRAAELAPDRIEYTYRYAEAFNDLATPDWDAALAAWRGLEPRVAPGFEREVILLREADVLIKQKKNDEARTLLARVTEPKLAAQKQKLVAALPPPPVK